MRAYIDKPLILITGDWIDYLQDMELLINKTKEKGLKCNIEKYFFGHTEMEYLGFWVTRNCVQPINRKVEGMKNMDPPTPRKGVRQFIGVMNY